MGEDAIRLLCLPHSGASARVYSTWQRLLPAWLVVQPVELPGRGTRFAEPLRTDLRAVVEDLADRLSGEIGERYAVLGHSLGAVVGFELSHALIERGGAAPLALFASASEAPAIRDDRGMARPRTDGELLADLRRLGGTPGDILDDAELMDLILPVLRADFLMAGTYRYRAREPLPCPIHVFGGRDDDLPIEALRSWRAETSRDVAVSMLEGGHFFLHHRAREVLDIVIDDLRSGAADPGAPASHPFKASAIMADTLDDKTVRVGPLRADGPLPMLVEAGRPDLSLIGMLPELRSLAERHLPGAGALLFRGFRLEGAEAFRTFAAGFGHPLLTYEFGSTPRSKIAQGVYTSTEYPRHQHIPLHNEQSYTRDWPMKIWFYCHTAAPRGGETPIADSRAVYRDMPQAVRTRFAEKELIYVRNFGNGLDVSWREVFGTESRDEVEAYCAAHGIQCEWKEDGELRTKQRCQAVANHPGTGEPVWFNQAHLFHVSNLEPEVRSTLLDLVEEEDLPRNVTYGDASPIGDETLETVRAVLDRHTIAFPWQSGDVAMLDNMLVAHGRAPFDGPRNVIVAMAEAHGSR